MYHVFPAISRSVSFYRVLKSHKKSLADSLLQSTTRLDTQKQRRLFADRLLGSVVFYSNQFRGDKGTIVPGKMSLAAH